MYQLYDTAMGKKRSAEAESDSEYDESVDQSFASVDTNAAVDVSDDENNGEGEEQEIVNVDFDFYDPKEIDFHAIKNLLRQVLDADNITFDLSALADLVLESPGTTIKVDGEESDPFALLSVVDMKKNSTKDVMKQLRDYFILQTSKNPEFNRKLRQLFSANASIGLVVAERLINMPIEVIPPMYRIYLKEHALAKSRESTKDSTPEYDYYLIVSKSFTEEQSKLDSEERRPLKKGRGLTRRKETFYFHPEDEIFNANGLYNHSYKFRKQGSDADSKRAFQDMGIEATGHLILLSSDGFSKAIDQIEAKYPPPEEA